MVIVWSSFKVAFKCKPEVCNGCHDLMQKALKCNDIAIVFVEGFLEGD